MLGQEPQAPDTARDLAAAYELPSLPLATAAATLRRLAGLGTVAAAYHAAKGNAYTYAGTLIVAARAEDPLDGETTSLLFVDPNVLHFDADGVVAAVAMRLPAPRIVIR